MKISDELSIRRIGNHFELVPYNQTGICIADVNDLPFNFFINDTECRALCVNELCASILGNCSANSMRGASIFDLTSHETALQVAKHDLNVMQNNTMKIVEEELRHDYYNQRCISFKHPLYNDKQKIIGVFGCAIFLERDSLADSLNKIVSLGLLNNSTAYSLMNNNPHQLSERETQCLHHAMRGKSAREIGLILNLSRRTIESHFNNIKMKMNVNSRSEMVDIGWKNYS